jgi:pheromone shutdown protein TraB
MDAIQEILETVRAMRQTQLAAVERQRKAIKKLLLLGILFLLIVLTVFIASTLYIVIHPK